MNRKEFLHICGGACLGLTGFGLLLQSCGTSEIFPSSVNEKVLSVDKALFEREKNGKINYRKYILVQPAELQNPLVIFRDGETKYTALLLKCTHQGNELSVSGNILTCAAHGSEFDSEGKVISGPASAPLKSFPVRADEKMIYVELNG